MIAANLKTHLKDEVNDVAPDVQGSEESDSSAKRVKGAI
jgi:hypothetical protein